MATIYPGLCSVTLRHVEPEQIIDLAAENGLEAIEWGGDVHVPPGEISLASHLGERCRAAGVATPSYGSFLVAGGPDTTADVIAANLDTAVALQTPNISVWTSFRDLPDCPPDRRAEITRQLADIVSSAADRGLTVSLEYCGWTLTHTSDSTVALLDDVATDNLFTYWQPVFWDDELLDDADGQIATLQSVVTRVSHLHIYARRGMDRFPLADAEAVVPRALELTRSAFGTWQGARVAFLEFVVDDDPANLPADATTLRSWLAHAD